MGSSFGEEVQKLMSASEGMAQRQKALEAKYKGAMEAWWGGRPVDTPLEDRKKLHNLVLDLKELEKRLVFSCGAGQHPGLRPGAADQQQGEAPRARG